MSIKKQLSEYISMGSAPDQILGTTSSPEEVQDNLRKEVEFLRKNGIQSGTKMVIVPVLSGVQFLVKFDKYDVSCNDEVEVRFRFIEKPEFVEQKIKDAGLENIAPFEYVCDAIKTKHLISTVVAMPKYAFDEMTSEYNA